VRDLLANGSHWPPHWLVELSILCPAGTCVPTPNPSAMTDGGLPLPAIPLARRRQPYRTRSDEGGVERASELCRVADCP
jgi:hypothetical protein